MRHKQTLKQKDFDSYCIKHIREAQKQGACCFKPNKDLIAVYDRISEMIAARHPDLNITLDCGEITIIKQQPTQSATPLQKKEKPKLHPNTIFTPMRKS